MEYGSTTTIFSVSNISYNEIPASTALHQEHDFIYVFIAA